MNGPQAAPDAAQATRQVINHFYQGFAKGDWRAMGAAYAADVHFSDPVFELDGDDARLMWRMLCEQAREFRASHEIVSASATSAHVRWQAWYRFSSTGRPVHNQIEARLQLANGLIVRHQDDFDFWRWSRQALGLPGMLLGWSPLLHNKVRKTAAASLQRFKAKQAA